MTIWWVLYGDNLGGHIRCQLTTPIDESFSEKGKSIYVEDQTEGKYSATIRPRLIKEMENITSKFKSAYGNVTNINIIDIGCGQGLVGIEIAERLSQQGYHIKLFSSDISEENIRNLREKSPFLINEKSHEATTQSDLLGFGRSLLWGLFSGISTAPTKPEHITHLVNAIPRSDYGPPGCVSSDKYFAELQKYIRAENTVSIVISSGTLCLQVIPTQTSLEDMRIVQEMLKSGVNYVTADGMKPPLINPSQQSTGAELVVFKNHRENIINPKSIDDGGLHWTIALERKDSKTLCSKLDQSILNLCNCYDPVAVLSNVINVKTLEAPSTIQSMILINSYIRSNDSEEIKLIEECIAKNSDIKFYLDGEMAARLGKSYDNVLVAKNNISKMLAAMPDAAVPLLTSMPLLFVKHSIFVQENLKSTQNEVMRL